MNNKMSPVAAGFVGLGLAFFVHQSYADDANVIGRFEVTHYVAQGNTLLDPKDIDQLLLPYTGKDKDFASVEMALETLEAAYRAKGFDLVRVVLLEQKLNHGIVTFQVYETKIGKISVAGNKFFSAANIKSSLPALKEGETPVMADVSANLKLANENPSKKTTVQLRTADEDGYANAILQVVDQKSWSAAIGVDDTGDNVTGRNRLNFLYQNTNVGGWDHVLSMQYTTSFAHPNDVSIYGIGYHIPLYTLTDSLDFYGSYSNVNSGTVTAGFFDLAVSGSGTVAGTKYNHNMLKVGNYDSTLSLGIDYKIFNNDVAIAGLPVGGHVVVHPANVTYAGNWAVTGTSANFWVALIRNIPGGNNSSEADFANSRTNATPDYTLLRFGGTYLKTLPADWQFRFNFMGQETSDALVPGEQFGMGGSTSVRGFTEREYADDKGYSANLEAYTPNLCKGDAQCRVLGFYDSGYVARNDPLPAELQHESIGSVGVGLRYTFSNYLLTQVDVAHVVDTPVDKEKGSNRIDFKVVCTF